MMEIGNINQTLAQLEHDLREIDSARKQVEKVTKDSNNLTNATSSLVKEVIQMSDKIANETSVIILNFSQKLTDYEKRLGVANDEGKNSIIIEVGKFRESANDLKIITENAINEIKSLSTKTIKEQESEISKTIVSILGYCKVVQGLVDNLSALNLYDQLDKMSKNLLATQKEILSENIILKNLTNVLTDKITSVEIPKRFDNIDVSIKSVNQEIIQFHLKNEALENNLKLEMTNHIINLRNDFNKNHNLIIDFLGKNTAEMKKNIIISYILVFLIIAVGVIIFIK